MASATTRTLTSEEAAHARIQDLIRRQMMTTQEEGDNAITLELVSFIRRGRKELVLDEIKNGVKHGTPGVQVKTMSILNQCLLNSGLEFAQSLSTEGWTERFFRAAKTTQSMEVRVYIMRRVIEWSRMYATQGFARLLYRFKNSKVIGGTFEQVSRQCERERNQHQAESRRATQTQNRMQTFDNMRHRDPNQVLNNVETFLLEAQADLASLEYALEVPQLLDSDMAKTCAKHKMTCFKLLGSSDDLQDEARTQLMQLLEQISVVLDFYEAITGIDMREGNCARQEAVVALDDDNASPDSDDDGFQRTLRLKTMRRTAQANTDAQKNLVQAQQATNELMEQERMETNELRRQLEDLRQKHEELQNKFKDAKAKNRMAVATLEEYAAKLDARSDGENGAVSLPPKMLEAAPSVAPFNPAVVKKMRSEIIALRRCVREVKEQYARDLTKESNYFSTQLNGAMANIVAAAQRERQGDQMALQWAQQLYVKEMKLRKQYYNTIQELKGSIRVYCRVRPMLPKEIADGHKCVMSSNTEDELKVVDQNGRPKLFEFDQVYAPEAPQSKVFEDTSPLIDSVVDGYNVCIFAYGQTGSGKTFTMGGGNTEEDKGINPRALERLFSIIEERKETEESSVMVSVLEIYCESIRDLLVSRQESAKQTYEVKQGGPYGTYVSNLTETVVTAAKDIDRIMERANMSRSEGTTNMNEHSSRSHMILYIIIKTRNKQTNVQSYGKLSLVDLAGSERLDKSGAEGQMMKEAVAINKSLSSLGDVIAGLAQGQKHIPFRNSVLTFLLQDSMAGQAKVLMFVCVSPASYNISESNSSLQFASRARGVAFGQIKKNATTVAK